MGRFLSGDLAPAAIGASERKGETRPPYGPPSRRLDAFGLSLAAIWVVLPFGLARLHGQGRPWPIAMLSLAGVVAVVGGRALGMRSQRWAPMALTALIVIAIGTSWPISAGPGAGPFNYRNATATSLIVAVTACSVLASTVRSKRLRLVAAASAIVLGLVAAAAAMAAGLGLLMMAIPLLCLMGRLSPRRALLYCLVGWLAVLTGTVVVAMLFTGDSGSAVIGLIDPVRVQLWHEAMELFRHNPLGVGPGSFATFSPTGGQDLDLRWAHHEYLQMGAELGWAGMALTIATVTWGFAALRSAAESRSGGVVAAFGAAGLAAIAIQGAADHVLHYPAIVLAMCLLQGSIQVADRKSSS